MLVRTTSGKYNHNPLEILPASSLGIILKVSNIVSNRAQTEFRGSGPQKKIKYAS
jgi:hypothetical protein